MLVSFFYGFIPQAAEGHQLQQMMMAEWAIILRGFQQAQHEDPKWYKAPHSAKGHEINKHLLHKKSIAIG